MVIVLTGGGTGGHVFPALSVAAALRDPAVAGAGAVDLLYVGLKGGPEARIAPEHGLPFRSVWAGPVRGKNPLAMLRSLMSIVVGTVQAQRLLGRSRASAVLATGGYVTVPVALAARLRRLPLLVYLPDVEPGWAVRLTSRLARRVATTTEQAAARLPRGKTVVTGYPVRGEFRSISHDEARRRLGIEGEGPMLLVAGATHGAASVNDEVARRLEELLSICRLVHVCGPAHHARFAAIHDELPARLRLRYSVRGFMDDLPVWMLAADLAVMRAGASVLGELPAARLPAILVPYRYAGAHQRRNAEYLAEREAALLLDEDRISRLYDLVEEVLADDARRQSMRRRLEALDRPEAARDIARLVLAEAGEAR